jgi:glycosyltransferase involved in cell wall biosynthesis
MTSKKIAFLHSSLKFGGGERVTLNLAEALQGNGYKIDILLMSKEGELLAEAESKFNVIDLQCDRTYKLPGILFTYLWQNKPDALISSFWKLNLCSCLAKLLSPKLKLILWEHSPPRNDSRWHYAISASVCYRAADKIVTVSTGVYKEVDRWTIGLRRKLVTIFNPIIPPAIEQIKLSKKRPTDEHRIVSVGRFDKNKNHELLLRAFALLTSEYPAKLKLVVLGDGEPRRRLELFSSSLGLDGKVDFLGFHRDPYEVLATCDLLVVASNSEGLPSVIIEAMYCGLPIVSTNCGEGINDILVGDTYGRIVPTNDVPALAKAMAAELETRRSREVQVIGAQRFLPHVAAEQFLRILRP